MEAYEHRVINGILKSGLAASTPQEVEALLRRDFELIVDPARREELWPCVWALTSVLERQFSGTIFVNAGYNRPLPAPMRLGHRVVFDRLAPAHALTIAVGKEIRNRPDVITGDVRGISLSWGRLIQNGAPANPVASFALAGYLGYAALGRIVGLDPYHESFTKDKLSLSNDMSLPPGLPESLTFIGLGQLGQAYLALLFFLDPDRQCSIHLIDKDAFEISNRTTQILLEDSESWEGAAKAEYFESQLRELGWKASGEKTKINWGWQRRDDYSPIGVVGVDNFDTRRMATAAGFDWLFEAGVGTSFVQPKVTWHSFPGRPEFGKIFPADPLLTAPSKPKTDFERQLLNETPGGCGWVRYNNISASAPSLGLVAAAYLWSEILQYSAGRAEAVGGIARLWSPLLPYSRQPLSAEIGEPAPEWDLKATRGAN